jgi:hypothetical protein
MFTDTSEIRRHDLSLRLAIRELDEDGLASAKKSRVADKDGNDRIKQRLSIRMQR